MNKLFASIGRTVVRHRWKVISLWAALLVFGLVFAPRLQEVFEREFVTGNTGDSQAAADIIAGDFTSRSAFQEQLVFTSDSLTVDDPQYKQAAEPVFAAVEGTERVTSIDSYFSTGDPSLVSADGRTTPPGSDHS